MSSVFNLSLRSFSRDVRLYLLATLFLGLSVDGVYAVLFNLYLIRLGYATKLIGLINSAGLFTFAFTSLPAGILGSRFGNRNMIQAGILAVICGGILVPLAEFGPKSLQVGGIVVGYMILMSGFSLYFVNGGPFLMAATQTTSRNQAFSVQTAISSFAGFAGSLFGGVLPRIVSRFTGMPLTSPDPYRYPMQVMVLLIMPAFFLIRATSKRIILPDRPKSNDKKSSIKLAALPLALVGIIAVIRLLQVAGLGATSTFINVYLDTELHISTTRIGILTSLSRLIAVPAALLVPALTKKYGNMAVAVIGSFGAAIFILPIAFVPHWLAAGLGYIGARMMTNIRFPAFQVYALELVSARYHSLISGVMGMAAGGSFALMAFFGGFIVTAFSFRNLFLTGAGITLLGTVLMILFYYSRFSKRPLPTLS